MNWTNSELPIDSIGDTQPTRVPDPMAQYQPIRIPHRVKKFPIGLILRILLLGMLFCLAGTLAAYLFGPGQTRILLLGIDRPPEGTQTSRSDTIIFMQVNTLTAKVTMLSIPRDLWMPISVPGVGENRINTAHFFAEANKAGSGPAATIQTIRDNFGLSADYFVRLRFDGFTQIVDALGGVDLHLSESMGIYEAGDHHLNSTEALAFVRDRKGADDFFRMQHAQAMMKSILRQIANPLTWPRLPLVATATLNAIDTNIPIWAWPRLGAAFLRAGPNGLDVHSLSREMVIPTITSGGAQVLMPRWDVILPWVQALFKA